MLASPETGVSLPDLPCLLPGWDSPPAPSFHFLLVSFGATSLPSPSHRELPGHPAPRTAPEPHAGHLPTISRARKYNFFSFKGLSLAHAAGCRGGGLQMVASEAPLSLEPGGLGGPSGRHGKAGCWAQCQNSLQSSWPWQPFSPPGGLGAGITRAEECPLQLPLLPLVLAQPPLPQQGEGQGQGQHLQEEAGLG